MSRAFAAAHVERPHAKRKYSWGKENSVSTVLLAAAGVGASGNGFV